MWCQHSWLASWRRRFTWNSLTDLKTVTKLDYSAKAFTVSNNRLVISIVVSTITSFVSVSSKQSRILASMSTSTPVLSLQSGWTTFLLFGASIDTINAVKRALAEKFNMKDVGELTFFLGIQVNRDRADKTIMIREDGYVNMILKKFQMLDAKPASIPIPHGVKLIKLDEQEESTIDDKIYQSKVGSLMYAMLCTHPDLAYTVSQISQFNNHPSEEHDAATNRVFKYLRGTSNLRITFDGKVGLEMRAYSDANWGGEVDRKSVGGYLFCLAGGAVSWAAKKQPTVALSSMESEYMALTQAAKESIWIQRLIEELGIPIANVNVIYADNQGSIALAKNPEYHARTKHIDIQHHFVRECVENGSIILQYVPTNEMAADAMTKGLTRDLLRYLRSLMGFRASQDVEKWEC